MSLTVRSDCANVKLAHNHSKKSEASRSRKKVDKENDSAAINTSSPSSDGSTSADQCHHEFEQQPEQMHQTQPYPQRDFYRFPIKVHRAAYRYEVRALSRVREAYSFESAPLTELPRGTLVLVEEIWSNRARISSPVCGWLSVYSSRGVQLLMPLDANAAKIGGHIVFKDEMNRVRFAEVTGYDHHCGLHSVMREHHGLQWVSLRDPNLRYIPKQRAQKRVIRQAPTPEMVVNQCMSVDYPSMSTSMSMSTMLSTEAENGSVSEHP